MNGIRIPFQVTRAGPGQGHKQTGALASLSRLDNGCAEKGDAHLRYILDADMEPRR